MSCNSITAPITIKGNSITAPITTKKVEITAPITIGRKGDKGDPGDGIEEMTAGASILSYSPVAIIDDQVFPYDPLNITHLFAFSGFSLTAANAGEEVSFQKSGFIEWAGFASLTKGAHYLAGSNASLVTSLTTELFSRVIAYASGDQTIKIINQIPTIRT